MKTEQYFRPAAAFFSQVGKVCEICGGTARGNLGQSAHLRKHVAENKLITSSRPNGRGGKIVYSIV